MKKVSLICSSFLIGGVLLSGCSESSEIEDESKIESRVLAEQLEQTQQDERDAIKESNEIMDEEASSQLEEEYDDLGSLVEGISRDMKPDSEFRKKNTHHSDFKLATSFLDNIDRFDDEIEARGVREEIEDLRFNAKSIVSVEDGPSTQIFIAIMESLSTKFYIK